MKYAIVSEPPLRHGLHTVFKSIGWSFQAIVDHGESLILLNQRELKLCALVFDGAGSDIARNAQPFFVNGVTLAGLGLQLRNSPVITEVAWITHTGIGEISECEQNNRDRCAES